MEGTKARLRVLESRFHSSTQLSSVTNTSSSYLLNSQHDYETNRSTASTTLMMSRRGGTDVEADIEDDTEINIEEENRLECKGEKMPPPNHSQISTPSMKAMVHLPMDDDIHNLNCNHHHYHHQHQHNNQNQNYHHYDGEHQHSNNNCDLLQRSNNCKTNSSNNTSNKNNEGVNINAAQTDDLTLIQVQREAANESDQQLDDYHKSSEREQNLMTLRNQVQALKRFSGSTTPKPSKIPLPGCKATSYFIGGGIGGGKSFEINLIQ